MAREFELRIINKPAYYIEMVALLNRVIKDRTYRRIQFNDSQDSFLDLFKDFRIEGCELFELYLYEENIHDIYRLESVLKNYTKSDFLYLLCGEEFSRSEIGLLIEKFDSIQGIIANNKYLERYNCNSMRFIFERTDEFVDKLIDVFKILNKEVVELLVEETIYEDSISKVSLELKSKMPLDVAQGIMGKKFKRVFDFNTYYFIPSYFYGHQPMRTFNEKTQVVIYPLQEADGYNKNMLVNALKIIGDQTRLEIIEKLSVRPMYGKELANELGIVTSTVSHHLEQLRSIGLIHEEREKNTKYFSINRKEYNRFCDGMKRFIEK